MLELIFPFLSLIDAPDIWVKEPRPSPAGGVAEMCLLRLLFHVTASPIPSPCFLAAHRGSPSLVKGSRVSGEHTAPGQGWGHSSPWHRVVAGAVLPVRHV